MANETPPASAWAEPAVGEASEPCCKRPNRANRCAARWVKRMDYSRVNAKPGRLLEIFPQIDDEALNICYLAEGKGAG